MIRGLEAKTYEERLQELGMASPVKDQGTHDSSLPIFEELPQSGGVNLFSKDSGPDQPAQITRFLDHSGRSGDQEPNGAPREVGSTRRVLLQNRPFPGALPVDIAWWMAPQGVPSCAHVQGDWHSMSVGDAPTNTLDPRCPMQLAQEGRNMGESGYTHHNYSPKYLKAVLLHTHREREREREGEGEGRREKKKAREREGEGRGKGERRRRRGRGREKEREREREGKRRRKQGREKEKEGAREREGEGERKRGRGRGKEREGKGKG
ncbi:Zinc finger CCCH domain-containing protein 18, partial [Ophiophagus hannah]